MNAALKTENGRFTIEEVETPVLPAADWVRARTRVAGICGTDLRHWDKHEPELACHVVGHETAGEVVEVAPDVTSVAVGDRVVVKTVLGCGECDWCPTRDAIICAGTSMRSVRRASRESMPSMASARSTNFTSCPRIRFRRRGNDRHLSVCLHAQHPSGLTIGDKVAIIGAGPIGLRQLMLAKASGADGIIVDKIDNFLELARKLGADRVINSAGEDPVGAAMEFSDGRGVDIAFECAGGESMAGTLPQVTQMARWCWSAGSARARQQMRWSGSGSHRGRLCSHGGVSR